VKQYDVLGGLYVALALAIGMIVREYARAVVADRLGDPNPRRWGWLSLDPRAKVDPFGTVILPALLVVLWIAGISFPPFAYAKPLPFDPTSFRRYKRDVVLVSIAGPFANLALAIVPGLLLRAGLGSIGPRVCTFLAVFVLTQLTLTIFHLLPIPGLDGARMLALVMPPHAREVYRNLDQYLVLFVLVIFFLFGTVTFTVVAALRDLLVHVIVGSATC
jgi:Zn-dependent protease